MKPIVRWTLRQRRASTIWWVIGISAYVALEIGLYPTIAKQGTQFNQAVSQLPDSVKAFINAGNDFLSPAGFLGSEIFFLILPLLFAILLIGLGSSLLAREEQEGTIELLLSRPLSRRQLLAGKALAGLLISGLVAAGVTAVIIFVSWLAGLHIAASYVIAAVFLCYLLALLFGAVAYLVTAAFRNRRGLAISLSTSLLLLSYLLTSLEKQVHWLLWPARLLPYHYYQPRQVLAGHFNWPAALCYLAVIAVCGLLADHGFRRRDIG